ncbi:unnamed protein product [Plasmodium vivax]|uniref:(malaria parasite P. vivax) hypothetical protein n=1 Tax=Plasmodium vivax TaxID=5855 RepID=A0A8S4H6F1_PLAVI|nr:unnamed protein product [Plasmodium vivax]
MSEYITDVAKWKNYSFLNKVWNTYFEFDKTVIEDTNSHRYEGVCELILKNFGEEKIMLKDFCMKLLRNLGHYDVKKSFFNPSYDRCHILYNWIYNVKNNYKYSDEIITECFKDYFNVMSHNPDKHKCSYDSYNNFYESPIKMTILDIFNDNVKNILTILMDNHDKDEFSPQKFVCEFVKIYKNIHNTYCANRHPMEGKGENTCKKLRELKFIYDTYLLKDERLKNKIPSLDAYDNVYSNKCISQAKGLESDTVSRGSEKTYSTFSQDPDGNAEISLPSREISDENPGGSMSPTVSTALGTVAGASSVLALLYKFTPGRRWMHSGFGRKNGRINNDLYGEGPNEILFGGFQGEDMSSYNARYNIGYGSA